MHDICNNIQLLVFINIKAHKHYNVHQRMSTPATTTIAVRNTLTKHLTFKVSEPSPKLQFILVDHPTNADQVCQLSHA